LLDCVGHHAGQPGYAFDKAAQARAVSEIGLLRRPSAGAGDIFVILAALHRADMGNEGIGSVLTEPPLALLRDLGSVWRNAAGSAIADDDLDGVSPDPLTPRELECLSLLSDGMRTGEIATRLSIKPVTVGLHISNARRKLVARTREQAIAVAVRRGLI